MNNAEYEKLEKFHHARIDAMFANAPSGFLPRLPERDLTDLRLSLYNAKMMSRKADVRELKKEIRAYKRKHKLSWFA